IVQAMLAALANARQATAATKNRSRVSGGGAKPWRQKGTGRARQGSTRSPQWRHGGVVFGPNGRRYAQRLPEKMRRAAFAQGVGGAHPSGDHREVDGRDEPRPVYVRGGDRGDEAPHRGRGRRGVQGRRRRREREHGARQDAPPRPSHRSSSRLEEGRGHARSGSADREVLRGRGLGMPLKQYKATSPVRRFRQSASFEELTAKKAPERRLLERKLRSAGRNAQGRVTTRHRGGGEKRAYRIVDFKRDKDGIPARVKAIEYDPNRSARLALVVYRDGDKRYILAPNDLKVGDTVVSGPDAEARVGNCLPLEHIPTGTQIHG